MRSLVSGGRVALGDQFPFVARIYSSGLSTGFCGGGVLDTIRVVTAAHCVTEHSSTGSPLFVGIVLAADHMIPASELNMTQSDWIPGPLNYHGFKYARIIQLLVNQVGLKIIGAF